MTCHPSWPSFLILKQSLYLAYLHVCRDEESMVGHVTTQCVHVVICSNLHVRFNNSLYKTYGVINYANVLFFV